MYGIIYYILEHGRPIEFIRHRRESGGYAKVHNDDRWGGQYQIQRVDHVLGYSI